MGLSGPMSFPWRWASMVPMPFQGWVCPGGMYIQEMGMSKGVGVSGTSSLMGREYVQEWVSKGLGMSGNGYVQVGVGMSMG